MEWFSALKIISMIATGTFGALGILTDYKDKSGTVTKWGKVAIGGIVLSVGFSLFLYMAESAKATAGADEARVRYNETKATLAETLTSARELMKLQNKSLEESRKLKDGLQAALENQRAVYSLSREMSSKQAEIMNGQRSAFAAENRLRLWQLRTYLPLEPLAVYFVREYPMDQPALKDYVARISKLIAHRYAMDKEENLKNQTADFELSRDQWAPRGADEQEVFGELMRDNTRFTWKKGNGAGQSEIEFHCSEGGLEDLIHLRSQKEPSLKIESVAADFRRRVIIKTVRCENVFRWGRNTLPLSSVDLIGRRLTWENISKEKNLPQGQITKIAIALPYDYSSPQMARYVTVPDGQAEIITTAYDVGLGDISEEILLLLRGEINK